MAYLPQRPLLGYQDITTTEQLSGRLIDGAASYVKLVKVTGALGTGDYTTAHGITGMTRLVYVEGNTKDASPQWFTIPLGTISATGALFGLSLSVDSTNITVHIGTSWASANALSNLYIILEYLK